MGRNRYGRRAGWEDPAADRERELLLRDDDRKRRAQDRQKRAIRERDEFLSMQIAQAEFLEAAAAPPVRRRFQELGLGDLHAQELVALPYSALLPVLRASFPIIVPQ